MMRKLRGLLSVVLLVFACGPAGTTFERQDVGFAVIMPGTATCGSTVVVDTAKGRLHQRTCSFEAHHWLELTRGIYPTTFAVTWYELPAGLSARDAVAMLHAKEVQDGERILHGESGRGDTLREKPIMLGGEPGFETEFGYLHMAPKIYLLDCLCAHHDRVYSLSLFGTLDAESTPMWNRMLESFRFTS